MNPREDPHLLSGAYAIDAVTPEEAATVEQAMETSEELRSEVAELSDTAVLLGLSVAPVHPSPDLRSRLLAAIETTPQLPAEAQPAAAQQPAADQQPATEAAPDAAGRQPTPHVAPRQPQVPGRPARAGAATGPRGRGAGPSWARRPAALLAAVAAAVVLVFGAGVLVANLVRPSGGTSQAATWSAITSAADAQHRKATVAGGGTVDVYWSASVGASAVRVRGAEAPAGKAMQLWTMEGGKATSAGLWHPPAGTDHQVLKGAMHKGQTFGITIEPAGGSKQPTSDPVVAIPIT